MFTIGLEARIGPADRAASALLEVPVSSDASLAKLVLAWAERLKFSA